MMIVFSFVLSSSIISVNRVFIKRNIRGGSNVSAAAAVKALGDAAQKEKDYNTALENYAEAISLLGEYEDTFEDTEAALVVAACRINAARCQMKLGHSKAAVNACDAALRILDKVDDQSLRGTALYRRALARETVDPDMALNDASLALTLGESRARSLFNKLSMTKRFSLINSSQDGVQSGALTGLTTNNKSPDFGALLDRFAELDTSRLAAMLPLAKQFATPDALAAAGISDPQRAQSLASFLQRLESQDIERWGKRAQSLVKVFRRTARIIYTIKRAFPTTVYSTFFLWMGFDSTVRFLKIMGSRAVPTAASSS